MNHLTSTIIPPGTTYFTGSTRQPVTLSRRIYRIVLTRGVQEVTGTDVTTEDGFVKFYTHNSVGVISRSLVAMYPAGDVQQITSVPEPEAVLV